MTRLDVALLVAIGLFGRPSEATEPVLDAAGRALLDPLRDEALRPVELIERLDLAASAVVADIGAGPGFLSIPLAKVVSRGGVVATDIRADYLEVLRHRAREAKLENVSTRLVGPDHPGPAPASIDLVVLCQVDHYLRDRVHFFEKLALTLRPGGRIAIINSTQHRGRVVAAAELASLDPVDEWQPSPMFFVAVFRPHRSAP